MVNINGSFPQLRNFGAGIEQVRHWQKDSADRRRQLDSLSGGADILINSPAGGAYAMNNNLNDLVELRVSASPLSSRR
jgi:hypothetical protein